MIEVKQMKKVTVTVFHFYVLLLNMLMFVTLTLFTTPESGNGNLRSR